MKRLGKVAANAAWYIYMLATSILLYFMPVRIVLQNIWFLIGYIAF